ILPSLALTGRGRRESSSVGCGSKFQDALLWGRSFFPSSRPKWRDPGSAILRCGSFRSESDFHVILERRIPDPFPLPCARGTALSGRGRAFGSGEGEGVA